MKRPFAKTTEQLQCSKAGNFSPDSGYMILVFKRLFINSPSETEKNIRWD